MVSRADIEFDLLDGNLGTSLNAAAANGAGTALGFSGNAPIRTWALALSSTGTITTATVAVEGSLDGAIWFPLQVTKAADGTTSATVNYAAGGPALFFASALTTALRFVRANLSALTGGGTVTAQILAVGD